MNSNFKDELKNFVENNPKLVTKKATSIPGVYVLKYTKTVFFKGLWNEYLEECRGTLIDENYNVVARPFTKIYNRGERNTDIPRDTKVIVARKINGYMGSITMYNDQIICSTTGSVDSDYAKLLWQHVELVGIDKFIKFFQRYRNTTLCFEVVDPSDPHIIREGYGLWLLGMRDNKWEAGEYSRHAYFSEMSLDLFAEELGVKRPHHFVCQFGDLVKDLPNVQHEGWVVHSGETTLKMKSPYYNIKKFFARKSNVDDVVADNAKEKFPEEYYPLIDYIKSNLVTFNEFNEQERLAYIENFLRGNV
jgi:ATP-dependent RNA circularization protein (DNA/RNA ligase family)